MLRAGICFALTLWLSLGQPALAAPADWLRLPRLYQDGFVTLRSDMSLTPAQCRKAADLCAQAYAFDLAELGWTADHRAVTLAVASDAYQRQHHLSFGGLTVGDDIVVVCEGAIRKPRREYVYAHEFTHLLVARLFGSERRRGWNPIWNEGLAMQNGTRFGLQLNRSFYRDGRVPPPNRFMDSLTADQAQWLFAHGNLPDRESDPERWNRRYATGFQMIEYLRVHHDPQAVRHLGDALVAMHGAQSAFGEEFTLRFPVPLAAAEKEFVDFLRRTEGNPEARYAGTVVRPQASVPLEIPAGD